MATRKSDTFLSFPVTTGTYDEILKEIIARSYRGISYNVCIANAHMVVTAWLKSDFAPAIRKADIVTPDGLPVTWAMRLLLGIRQERVAGMDLLPDLISKAEEESIPVFFYGGTHEMLKTTRKYLDTHYPNLNFAGAYCPPFRALTENEENQVADIINESGARMVFVVLGCPKQEKWMDAMKHKISAVMVGVGGALPVMTGMQKRAPLWMQQSGLEWLYRLGQEPKRLFKRYAVTNTIFLAILAMEFVKLKVMRLKPVFQ